MPRPRRPGAPSAGPRSGPEAELQRKVTGTAQLYGWDWWHAPDVDPRLAGAYRPGWPDLVLAKASVGRVLFVELKNTGNYPSPDQRKWLALLHAGGLEVGVWWPKDLSTVIATLGPRQERLVLPVRYRSEQSVDPVDGRQ